MLRGKTGASVERPTGDGSTKKKKSKIVTTVTPILSEGVDSTTVMNMIEPTS